MHSTKKFDPQPILATLPLLPGVYRFFDGKGEVTKVENGLATIKVVTTNQNGESVVEGEAVAEA